MDKNANNWIEVKVRYKAPANPAKPNKRRRKVTALYHISAPTCASAEIVALRELAHLCPDEGIRVIGTARSKVTTVLRDEVAAADKDSRWWKAKIQDIVTNDKGQEKAVASFVLIQATSFIKAYRALTAWRDASAPASEILQLIDTKIVDVIEPATTAEA